MVLLEGEIRSGLFFCGFCLFDNILMAVGVYYADTRISKPAGCSSKIMRDSSKKGTMLSISWKDILTEHGKHRLHMRVIFLLMLNITDARK